MWLECLGKHLKLPGPFKQEFSRFLLSSKQEPKWFPAECLECCELLHSSFLRGAPRESREKAQSLRNHSTSSKWHLSPSPNNRGPQDWNGGCRSNMSIVTFVCIQSKAHRKLQLSPLVPLPQLLWPQGTQPLPGALHFLMGDQITVMSQGWHCIPISPKALTLAKLSNLGKKEKEII